MSIRPHAPWPEGHPAILESPALYRENKELPAYEVKFLLSEADALEVERRLQPRLTTDPHGDPALDHAYRVTSVYFDTPALDVFHRSEGFRRRKYRVRRYGLAAGVFLEQKTKSAQRVRKRRTSVPAIDLSRLIGDPSASEDEPHWAGRWFTSRLTARDLRPLCRVSYERLALIGTTSEGPIRVTFDRRALGEACAAPIPDPVDDGRPLLHDQVITEFKFLGAMPASFKRVIEDLRLAPTSVSKYRRCMEALGLAGNGSKPDV